MTEDALDSGENESERYVIVESSSSEVALEASSLVMEPAPNHETSDDRTINLALADDYKTRYRTPWRTDERNDVGDPPEEFGWFFYETDANMDDYLRKRNYTEEEI